MRFSNRTLATIVGVAALSPLAAVTASLGAQDATASKLSVHGYLTQGAAVSDSGMVVGISRQGTTNYRRAAILMRYAQTPKDAFVIQVAHRRLGDSPIMNFEPDVKVDWAFYERHFGDQTSLRVGKAPIPFGIFNETRYTGTLLPFYRAPYSVYFEGAYTSETLDGLVLTHTLLPEAPFHLEASVYGGNYDLLEFSQAPTPSGAFAFVLARARANNSLGTQLWLYTPLDGLRVGGGASRATMEGGLLRAPGEKETARNWHAGLDGNFDRFTLRGEYRNSEYKNLSYVGYYGQTGARLFRGLSVNVQAEVGTATIPEGAVFGGVPYPRFEIPLIHDNSVGLNYAFRSDLMLKLEAHQTKGFNTEEGTNMYTSKPTKGSYAISSLSLAF